MRFTNPAWRRRPVGTALRVGESLLLRRMGRTLVSTPLGIGGLRVWADLTTAQGLELYRYGCDDPDFSLVRSLLRPGDVFVDAGANIGLFSLAAAEVVGPTGAPARPV